MGEEPINLWNKDFQRREGGEIQLLADGVDGNSAGIATGYAQSILSSFQSPPTMTLRLVSKSQMASINMVTVKERMWFNEDLDNAQYMIPGIICVLLTVVSMMLSSINLVREKEIGTLEQLMVTPIKRYQLLLGKILPFLLLTFIELGIVTFFGKQSYYIRFRA